MGGRGKEVVGDGRDHGRGKGVVGGEREKGEGRKRWKGGGEGSKIRGGR